MRQRVLSSATGFSQWRSLECRRTKYRRVDSVLVQATGVFPLLQVENPVPARCHGGVYDLPFTKPNFELLPPLNSTTAAAQSLILTTLLSFLFRTSLLSRTRSHWSIQYAVGSVNRTRPKQCSKVVSDAFARCSMHYMFDAYYEQNVARRVRHQAQVGGSVARRRNGDEIQLFRST